MTATGLEPTTIECGFTLKSVLDMIITYNPKFSLCKNDLENAMVKMTLKSRFVNCFIRRLVLEPDRKLP